MLYLNNKTAYLTKRCNLQWIFISDRPVSLRNFDPITCHTKQIDNIQDTDKKRQILQRCVRKFKKRMSFLSC